MWEVRNSNCNTNNISVCWKVFPASRLKGKSQIRIFTVVKNTMQKKQSSQLSRVMKIKRVRVFSITPFPIFRYLLGLSVWLETEMLLRKKSIIVLTKTCLTLLLRNYKEEEGLMVQLANGKQQNLAENCLLVYLKLTTKNMLKFMLSMRKIWISISCHLGNKKLYREAEGLEKLKEGLEDFVNDSNGCSSSVRTSV